MASANSSPATTTVTLQPAWDYLVADSRTGGPAFQWIDARSGTRYELGDDSGRMITLAGGQQFSFYGQAYNQFYLSSNGFLTFNGPFTRFQGVIPFEAEPNNAIYGYGEDLNPGARLVYGTPYDNGVYVLQDGQRAVVQYNEVEHWARGNPETFQIILDLATNAITLQYQTVSWPDFTTVGLENGDGSRGLPTSYANSANLTSGLAFTYTPVFGQAGSVCR